MLTISSVAVADQAENRQAICHSPQAKSLMGERGSCRVVIAPMKIEKRGSCRGLFQSSLPCIVTFEANSTDSLMNILCGTDLSNPVLNQDLEAQILGYKTIAIAKDSEGIDHLISDHNTYSLITHPLVELQTIEDSMGVKGEITLALEQGSVNLTDVVCQ